MKRIFYRSALYILPTIILILIGLNVFSQKAYFIDGYHGGIYGHIPLWQTKIMVDKLNQYPNWRINLELEPESWDTIKKNDIQSYNEFKEKIKDQSANGLIEYVNPAYAQSYMYNISGESIIRQFSYGMEKLSEYFPGIIFTTYSSEEPCFTSALPQILKSYGFKYASLKKSKYLLGWLYPCFWWRIGELDRTRWYNNYYCSPLCNREIKTIVNLGNNCL